MAVVGVAGMVAFTATATGYCPIARCIATIGLTGTPTGIGVTTKQIAKVITHRSTDW